MTVTLHVPSVRSLALVFAGVLLGTLLVAPVLARGTTTPGAIAKAATTTYTRTTSCQSMNFHTITEETGFNRVGRLLVRTPGPNFDIGREGDGYFLCDPNLPDKAVVTRVRFTLYDNSQDREVRYCALYRAGLGTTTAFASLDELAQVPTTGILQMPTIVRLVDTSIANATIDNTRWAYYLQCQIRGTALVDITEAGIYGADVTYNITAANG